MGRIQGDTMETFLLCSIARASDSVVGAKALYGGVDLKEGVNLSSFKHNICSTLRGRAW